VIRRTVVAFITLAAFGCGTVTHGVNQSLPVTTAPPGATVQVSCADGTSSTVVSPGTLLLRRNAEECAVRISKEGYQPETIVLQRTKSKVMIANVGASVLTFVAGVVGGVLICTAAHPAGTAYGACAVTGALAGLIAPSWLDARTGAMYLQRPARIDVTLRPITAR
jgi:hypothetical protein